MGGAFKRTLNFSCELLEFRFVFMLLTRARAMIQFEAPFRCSSCELLFYVRWWAFRLN